MSLVEDIECTSPADDDYFKEEENLSGFGFRLSGVLQNIVKDDRFKSKCPENADMFKFMADTIEDAAQRILIVAEAIQLDGSDWKEVATRILAGKSAYEGINDDDDLFDEDEIREYTGPLK